MPDRIPDGIEVTESGGLLETWDTGGAPEMPDMPILVVRQINVGVVEADGLELMIMTVGGSDWKLEYAFGFPMSEAGEIIEMLARTYYLHTQPEVEAEPVAESDQEGYGD